MEKIFNLEERSYAFSLKTIRFLESLPKDYMTQIMTKQLLRSATSIGANIAEGQYASSKKDFAIFYRHALKSGKETQYWLRLLRDAKKIAGAEMDFLLNEISELIKILAASILKIQGKGN